MKDKKWGVGVLCTLAILVFLGGCAKQKKKPAPTENPNKSVEYEKGADFRRIGGNYGLQRNL